MKDPTGGPAFPEVKTRLQYSSSSNTIYPDTFSVGGMSVRDWLMGQALNGLLASGRLVSDELINDALTAADLAIAAREKGTK